MNFITIIITRIRSIVSVETDMAVPSIMYCFVVYPVHITQSCPPIRYTCANIIKVHRVHACTVIDGKY